MCEWGRRGQSWGIAAAATGVAAGRETTVFRIGTSTRTITRTTASTTARSARTARAAAAAALTLAALGGVTQASAGTASATPATPVTSTTSAAAPAAPTREDGRHPRPASVSGSARIMYAFAPKDEIRFTVDARQAPYTHVFPGTRLEHGLPTDAEGTVKISHHSAETGRTYTGEATVDCLATGGPVATLTAVVTESDVLTVGDRIGLSIYQGEDGDGEVGDGRGGARLGFSWGIGDMALDAAGKPYQPVVGTCMAPAPFAPVLQGGYKVHHADIEVR
ncbi:hypothetical protein ACPC54_31860 [Kitasatospora sp. NPDC094028]